MTRLLTRILPSVVIAGIPLTSTLTGFAATVNGTDGDDVLIGTRGSDIIRAYDGDDVVTAGGGADDVRSGPGDDVVRLGPGADHHANPGDGGRDYVSGGPGSDEVVNAYVADLGEGNDRYLVDLGGCLGIDLGAGDDRAPGGSARFYGGQDDCVIRGGQGDDRIEWSGYDGPEGPNETTLYGGADADILRGGYNDDVLIGGRGPDVIHAAEDYWARSDVIVAGPGDDEIFTDWDGVGGPVDCGPGNDTVHGFSGDRVLIDCENSEP